MSDNSSKEVVPSNGGGFFQDLSVRARLIFRLMGDRRVKFWLKLLPIGTMFYLFFPEPIPVGPLDDAAIIWLGTTLFVDLIPQEIVQEHLDALTSVIEGEWREVKDEQTPQE